MSVDNDRMLKTTLDEVISDISNERAVQVYSSEEVLLLSFGIGLYSIIVVGAITYLLKIGHSPDGVVKSIGTMVIISAALLLLVVGYDDSQIAPVIGLLGTIAGYILGKDFGKDKAKE